MRLIRLQTDDNNCVFDNSFNTDIIIEPNAKIALQNIAIVKNPTKIIITPSNSTITYKLNTSGGAIDQTIVLNSETYTQNTYKTLFTDMTTRLNKSLVNTSPSNVGKQWQVSLLDNVTNIDFRQGKRLAYRNWTNQVERNIANPTSVTISGTSTVSDGSQFIYNPSPIIKGCGAFSIQASFTQDSEYTGPGIYIGLVEKQDYNVQSILVSNLKHGIHITKKKTSGNNDAIYSTITDGIVTSTAEVVGTGAFFTISGGFVEYFGEKLGSVLLLKLPLDPSTSYYPVVLFPDGANARILKSNFFYNQDPFLQYQAPSNSAELSFEPSHFHLPDGNPWSQTVGSTVYYENFYSDNVGSVATYRRLTSGGQTHYWQQTGLATWNIYVALPTSVSVPDNTAQIDPITNIISFSSTATTFIPSQTLNYIDSTTLSSTAPPNDGGNGIRTLSMSSDLATFLGYSAPSLTSGVQVTNYQFLAANIFDITDTADSFVVELLSLELDSYDGQTSDRRSILATVPKAEGADGTIIYEVNYPTFVNVRNRNPITLRNIRARILKSDLTQFTVLGTSNMTLLLD